MVGISLSLISYEITNNEARNLTILKLILNNTRLFFLFNYNNTRPYHSQKKIQKKIKTQSALAKHLFFSFHKKNVEQYNHCTSVPKASKIYTCHI